MPDYYVKVLHKAVPKHEVVIKEMPSAHSCWSGIGNCVNHPAYIKLDLLKYTKNYSDEFDVSQIEVLEKWLKIVYSLGFKKHRKDGIPSMKSILNDPKNVIIDASTINQKLFMGWASCFRQLSETCRQMKPVFDMVDEGVDPMHAFVAGAYYPTGHAPLPSTLTVSNIKAMGKAFTLDGKIGIRRHGGQNALYTERKIENETEEDKELFYNLGISANSSQKYLNKLKEYDI